MTDAIDHDPERLAPDDDLSRITARLYQHFGGHKGRATWSDMDDEMAHAAETKTLKQLTPEEYGHLAWHAMCWDRDDRAAVQYFLPKMLDDLAKDRSSAMDPGMLAAALKSSNWRAWPQCDRELVERWFIAWWRALLATQPDDEPGAYRNPVDLALKLIAFIDIELAPILDQWHRDRSLSATVQLARLVLDHAGYLAAGRLDGWDLVWEEGVAPQLQTQVAEWLRRPEVSERLESAFFSLPEADVTAAHLVSEALQFL